MIMLLAAHSIPCRSFSFLLSLLNFCHLAFSCIFLVALLVSRFLLQHGHSATPFHCLGIRQLELESHAFVEIHLAIRLSIPVSSHTNETAPPARPTCTLGSFIASRNASL